MRGLFAGGDCCLGGRDLTVEAVEDGKRAAAAIHAAIHTVENAGKDDQRHRRVKAAESSHADGCHPGADRAERKCIRQQLDEGDFAAAGLWLALRHGQSLRMVRAGS